MDPATLVAPSSPLGYPAPYWFIALFKLIGFVLHMVPMNLWYAGILVAMLLQWRGGDNARVFSNRLMKQMPIIVALGVNFGIVPLLFIQIAYYKAFYPATILMAWFWFAIVILLTFAYYGVYIYASALKNENAKFAGLRKAAGWISSIFFIAIGFLFANGFSLMANLSNWPSLWEKTSIAGAPLGIALNTGDPSLLPRWLMMFGLALMTTAAYSYFDAGFLARKESDIYKKWVPGFAFKLYTIGMIWFALTGTWYVFGTWSEQIKQLMFSSPTVILTYATAITPGAVWLLMLFRWRSGKIVKTCSIVLPALQLIILALNAVSRQIVQNAEIGVYYDVSAEQVNMQWSPMILFLVLLVAGVGVIIWMLKKAIVESRQAIG